MKRILSLLLAALMLVSVFTACSNDETPAATGDDTPASTPADSGDDTPAASGDETPIDSGDDTSVDTPSDTTEKTMHDVPIDKLDFGNEEFHAVAFEWQGYPHYFFAEEESTDPMETALYNRRLAIEDALNVKMTHFLYPSYSALNTAIDMEVNTGDSVIDMALLHCIVGVAQFTSGGYLYPLNDLPYIDVTAPWWNKEQMEGLRLGSKYYFGVNDFMIPCPYVIYFNKEMVADMADLEDPYQLVLDQKWTFDVFSQMARTATKDINTDGVYDWENDSFGVAVHDDSDYSSFLTAFDQPIAAKNADGRLEVALNTEKTADIFDKFAEMAKEHIFYPDASIEKNQITMDSGRLLFYFAPISAAEDLRDCEVDFGLLPYPKYDEAQEDYKSLDWGGLMCVPSTINNSELVGAVIELLAYESKKEVIPTYYDTVLDGQLAQDPETVKMLDILFDTICYEPAMNYWGLSGSMLKLLFGLAHEAVNKQNDNFASYYAEFGESAQKQIDEYYDTLSLLEDLYQ